MNTCACVVGKEESQDLDWIVWETSNINFSPVQVDFVKFEQSANDLRFIFLTSYPHQPEAIFGGYAETLRLTKSYKHVIKLQVHRPPLPTGWIPQQWNKIKY